MKITCPDCSTSYEVSAVALGPGGRNVKCARCGSRWHADGADDARPDTASIETDLPAEAGDDAHAAPVDGDTLAAETGEGDAEESETDGDLSDDWAAALSGAEESGDGDEADAGSDGTFTDTFDDDGLDEAETFAEPLPVANGDSDAPPPAQPVDIETLAKKPKIQVITKPPEAIAKRIAGAALQRARRIRPRRVVGAVFFLAALAVCGLAVGLRNPIVARMPDLAGLFSLAGLDVNLRGLEFRDLRTFRELENGTIVLVIEGTIENVERKPAFVPAVRFALRSEDAQEIYAWVLEPRLRRLDAGTTTRFRTRLSSPPELAADIQVRFVERGQQQARLQ
ncbi:zinc-ribbon domain-containing protein [Stappia stellulata]|uniref:zinc-ribbon domain-containing protein n=1 Tax=Stappia stellulata TaxID=71235 RepID=UPI000416F866|nr:zinc-ribbon domain-containing protein [Stappia stellulata]